MDKEDVVCIYNGILLSHKKNKTSSIYLSNIHPLAATWMQLEIIMLSEVSQKEKDKYDGITYMWDLKYGTNEHVYDAEADFQTEIRLVVAAGQGSGERGGLEVWGW